MKVKDLIKFLKKCNPEDIVGNRDFGVDSGDWTPLERRKNGVDREVLYPNLYIYSEEESKKLLKEQLN